MLIYRRERRENRLKNSRRTAFKKTLGILNHREAIDNSFSLRSLRSLR